MNSETTQSDSESRESISEERHPSLYLPDGDIVISAPKTNEPSTSVLFRLEMLSLRYHSPIFKDMLSLPGNASTNEQYDGVPRVRLTDDAEDLAGLFKAMNNPTTLPLKRSHPDTALELTGIMKLAVKYEIQAVRDIIVHHIESDWTCTLLEWERRWHLGAQIHQVIGIPHQAVTVLARSLPEPASAIRFSIDFGVPSILPLALYELAFTPRSATWSSQERLPTTDNLSDDPRIIRNRYARWELLKGSELHTVVWAKDWVSSDWRMFLGNLIQRVSDPHVCMVIKHRIPIDDLDCSVYLDKGLKLWLAENTLPVHLRWRHENIWKAPKHMEHILDDPLTAAQSLCEAIAGWDMCPQCTSECQKQTRQWASTVWEKLREYVVMPVD